MGMFDIIRGKVKCPHCHEMHYMEANTKSYDCNMSTFRLGDYIDKGNSNYVIREHGYCIKDGSKSFLYYIIVRNGQIVCFYNDDELRTNGDIMSLDNIEEGIGEQIEYEEMCEMGVGIAKELVPEKSKDINDTFTALGVSWTIREICKEEFVYNGEDERLKKLYEFWYIDNIIYKVTNEIHGDRIIRVLYPKYLHTPYYEIFYDKGDYKQFSIDNPYNFVLQRGCVLSKLK